MGTPVLRTILVIAAIAVGLLVLSKAFPTVDAAQPTVPVDQVLPTVDAPLPQSTPNVPESPGATDGGGGAEPKPIGQLELQVLNGTFESGLAAETQAELEAKGYKVVTTADAQGKPYEVTQISYLKAVEANAQQLAAEFFPGAQLARAGNDAAVDITIILGDDYVAARQGGGGEEAPAEEESPSA